jgi:hypothetical protein
MRSNVFTEDMRVQNTGGDARVVVFGGSREPLQEE